MTKEEMRALVDKLNDYTKAYDEGHPLISDKEWDALYFTLKDEEDKHGFAFEDSPTKNISYKVVNELKKVKHSHLMLSLAKTKSIDDLDKMFGDKQVIAMEKLDGLTCSLTYEKGLLVRAETRGNGEIGEDITHNALVIKSIPKKLPIQANLVIDGEVICTYENFKKFENDYDNPRNFASGSIRLKDSAEASKRNLSFIAWDIIEGYSIAKTLSEKLEFLKRIGFSSAIYLLCGKEEDLSISGAIDAIKFLTDCTTDGATVPIDGIVFKFNDIDTYESYGRTSHHFKGGIAYKFYDECFPTSLKDIQWQMGRTGQLTPVAIFNPVRIYDTDVERASLHNINIMNTLYPSVWHKGLTLYVTKRNQIIPNVEQVEEGGNEKDVLLIPQDCPYCGSRLTNNNGILYCNNPNCDEKFINKLDHFCSKKGLDIKGLSIATLDKLINKGWLNSIEDIFNLHTHRNEWIKEAGFGEKSVDNILNSIEKSKTTTLEKFIMSLGIPMIGNTLSKEICKHISSYEEFRQLIDKKFDFTEWEMFGEEKSNSIISFDYTVADSIYKYFTIVKEDNEILTTNTFISNKTFVITGKLIKFKNRQELKKFIEQNNGKVSDSITKKTSYLINNDKTSTTKKNIDAQKLNVPIISEDEFINLTM